MIPDGASLVLAVAFVVMMVCVHQRTPPDRSLWSQLGVAFALLYAGLVSIVYIVTITVVVPYVMRGQTDKVAPFIFDANGSFMSAVDGLGYAFMSRATWFAAPVFAAQGPEKWLRRVFLINGVWSIIILLAYMPLVIPAPYYQVIEGLSAVWIFSLPTLAILVALHFRQARDARS